MKLDFLNSLIIKVVNEELENFSKKSVIKEEIESESEADKARKKLLINHLDNFTRSYLNSILAFEMDHENNDEPLSYNHDLEDFELDSLKQSIEECKEFQKLNAKLFRKGGWTYEKAGGDFYLDRNGHGTGFWDKTESEGYDEEIGKQLRENSKNFLPIYAFIGDNNLIHIN